jgi:N6-L-threonylcarbamoyladenine synthase
VHILAIDTSCDETSAAVLKDTNVLSNVIASQVDLHKKWGGVVPDIARRAHADLLPSVIKEALSRANIDVDAIDLFAATYGPGLAIALEIGLKAAQNLAIDHDAPFAPVNHMEGHLLSPYAKNSKGNHPKPPSEDSFPYIGLLVSGGHTDLVLMKDFGDYTLLGETLDDAAGEAFDKVAKMLELGYPGGPILSEFAEKGDPDRFSLPVPMERSGDLDFSYSGLKTACLYKLEGIERDGHGRPITTWVYDFSASFVESVIKSLVIKLEAAADKYHPNGVLLGGGVMSNTVLRRRLRSAMGRKGIEVYQPYSPRLYTDNAAMIGIAAYYMAKRDDPGIKAGRTEILKVDRDPIAQIDADI